MPPQFHKLSTYKSILVVSRYGQLKRIYCPFPVTNSKRVILMVDALSVGNDRKIYYHINGTLYLYSYFSILSM